MSSRNNILLLLLAFASMLSACKGKGGKYTRVEPQPQAGATATNPQGQFDVKSLTVTNLDYTQLVLRGIGSYSDDDRSMSFNYRLHVVRGKAVWASLSLLGFEGVRILATPDSFKLIDRTKRQYISGSYAFLEQKLGLKMDFDLLQDLLIGNATTASALYLPGPPSPQGTAASFALSDAQGRYAINYFVGGDNHKLNRVEAQQAAAAEAFTRLVYSAFEPLDTQVMARKVLVDVSSPKTLQVAFDHRQVELNPTSLSLAFSIPADYEPIRY